jgi:hypothetical protein
MQLLDIILTGAIIGGALYLLYRSFWNKRGYCPGCTAANCPGKQDKDVKYPGASAVNSNF